MKNYMDEYTIEVKGYTEVMEDLYTDYQNEMKEYIGILSNAVKEAHCGWDEVKYKVMSYKNQFNEEFMVLCTGNREVRWIPIYGNSKGSNLQVLGENLW